MKRVLACLLACLLLSIPLANAVARATEPQRAQLSRVLVVEGGLDKLANKAKRIDDQALLVAALPATGISDIWYYDRSVYSECPLTAAPTVAERLALLSPWSTSIAAGTKFNNPLHSKALTLVLHGLAIGGAPAGNAQVLWVVSTDVGAEDSAATADAVSRLLGYGVTLDILLLADAPLLRDALAPFGGVRVTQVTDLTTGLLDTAFEQAGYQKLAGETLGALLAGQALDGLSPVPGEMVAVEFNAPVFIETTAVHRLGDAALAVLAGAESIPLKGGLFAWPDIAQVGGIPSEQTAQTAVPTMNATEGEPAAAVQMSEPKPSQQSSTDAKPLDLPGQPATSNPAVSTNAPTNGDMPVQTLTPPAEATAEPFATTEESQSAATEPQVMLYLKPAPQLALSVSVNQPQIPYGEAEPVRTVTLTAGDAFAASLIADSPAIVPTAAVIAADGASTPATLTGLGGGYTVQLPKLEPGSYILRLAYDAQPLGVSTQYALDVPVVFEAPLQPAVRDHTRSITLTVAPLLWHSGPAQQEVDTCMLFAGDYLPATAYSTRPDRLRVEPFGEGRFIADALAAGDASLIFTAASGQLITSVDVRVQNGTLLIVLEAAALLLLILLSLGLRMFLHSAQPRFRKDERLHIAWESEQQASITVPLKPYRGKGVTLWRLLMVGGEAQAWSKSKGLLNGIALRPRRDALELTATAAGVTLEGKQAPVTMPLVPEHSYRILIGKDEFFVELVRSEEGKAT